MERENGWILPDGKYLECAYNEHANCAKVELNMDEEDLEKIAVKVSCMPPSIRIKTLGLDRGMINYIPHFNTARDEMTNEQLNTIEKYCLKFHYRPPSDYFIQKDLIDMCEMSTLDILNILAK